MALACVLMAFLATIMPCATCFGGEIAPRALKVAKTGPKIAYSYPKSFGIMRISYYCHCKRCCGKEDGVMASGKRVYRGAVACNWLPFGTRLEIDGIGWVVVEDRGAKSIFGTKARPKMALDVYLPSHTECLQRGIEYRKVRYAVSN